MAPQVFIETPTNVKESFLRHSKHKTLHKRQLTQYNCFFEAGGRKIKCHPFTRHFWECVHYDSKSNKETTHHWEIHENNINGQTNQPQDAIVNNR